MAPKTEDAMSEKWHLESINSYNYHMHEDRAYKTTTYQIICLGGSYTLNYMEKLTNFLGDFTMISDHGCQIIGHREANEMARLGRLPKNDYWYPGEREYCIIIKSSLFKYSTTIERIRTAIGDFRRGWEAARGNRKSRSYRNRKKRKLT